MKIHKRAKHNTVQRQLRLCLALVYADHGKRNLCSILRPCPYRLPRITMMSASCTLQKYPLYSRSVSSTASASSNVSHLMRLLLHVINFLNSTRTNLISVRTRG